MKFNTLKTTGLFLTLAAAFLFTTSTTAFAQDWRWQDRGRWDDRQDRREELRGYNDGLLRGRADSRERRAFNPNLFNRNIDNDYRVGYRRGYTEGYREVNVRRDYDRYGDNRIDSRQELKGYNDGLDRGREDARDHRRLDPNNSSHYRDGNHEYREGFRRGYNEGYRQYDRRW